MLARTFLRAMIVGGTAATGDPCGPPCLTVDGELLDAADLDQLERVDVRPLAGGPPFSAVLLRGQNATGVLRIDGDGAARIADGERVTIVAWSQLDRTELDAVRARVAVVGDGNRLLEVRHIEIAGDR
jgi:aspartate 1-decarboxylase